MNLPVLVGLAAATLGVVSPAWAQGATTGLSEDRGRFEISKDGQKVGMEDFSLTRDGSGWVARGATEFHAPTGAGKVSGELHLNAAGAPLRYDWTSEAGKKVTSTTTFEGLKAKMSTNVGSSEPLRQDFLFNAPLVILDDNLYDHYAILARLYNWSARGPQNFAVLIPQEHMPGTITVEALAPTAEARGAAAELRVHTPDLEVLLSLDSSHRLLRISVPAAKAEIVRQ
jgi:hypothetical protein